MKPRLLTPDAETTRYSLAEAERMLPLIQAIAAEIVERSKLRRALLREQRQLEGSRTPEGLVSAISDQDAEIWTQTEGVRLAVEELAELGLTVLRQRPLTVHIPGQTVSGPLVFCWQEGDHGIDHGHNLGEEAEQRRRLRVRAPKGFRA